MAPQCLSDATQLLTLNAKNTCGSLSIERKNHTPSLYPPYNHVSPSNSQSNRQKISLLLPARRFLFLLSSIDFPDLTNWDVSQTELQKQDTTTRAFYDEIERESERK